MLLIRAKLERSGFRTSRRSGEWSRGPL